MTLQNYRTRSTERDDLNHPDSDRRPGPSSRYFVARKKRLRLGERTLVMGVVNVTPDSFSDGGEVYNVRKAIERALRLAEEGADIIDIGGESTRPGSEPVRLRDELGRVVPVITALEGKIDALISVDTVKSEVARQALTAGAHIVNDISGGRFDPETAHVAAEFEAGAVLMHIKGTPRDMQDDPRYEDLIGEVRAYLSEAADRFEIAGVLRTSIIVDPGIGFGKTVAHNLELIARCREFSDIAAGVMLGPSRKSFIGTLTGRPVKDRVEGTIAASVAGVLAGADMVRVHDVKQVVSALKVADAIKSIHNRPW